MKILVCGGRSYADAERVRTILGNLRRMRGEFMLVEGGATGADLLAREWARLEGVPLCTVPANWERFGSAAGPMRNGWMIQYLNPDMVIAFPGGRGTDDMARRAEAIGIPTYRILNPERDAK